MPGRVRATAEAIRKLTHGDGMEQQLPKLPNFDRAMLLYSAVLAENATDEQIALITDDKIRDRIFEGFQAMPDSKEKLVLVMTLGLTHWETTTLEERRRQAEKAVGIGSRTVIRYQANAELQLAVAMAEYEGDQPLMWIDVDESGFYTLGERPDWVYPVVFARRPGRYSPGFEPLPDPREHPEAYE